MAYCPIRLAVDLDVEEIITVHYFEYRKDFSFEGESHDFWEFLCVDKGEVQVRAGTETYLLKKGEMIFHKPNEFHSVMATGQSAPNLVVISFSCRSEAMRFFENALLTIGEEERNLLAGILSEAKQAFLPPFDNPYLTRMERATPASFGSEQLIKNYLEQLLIGLLRKQLKPEAARQLTKTNKLRSDLETYHRILEYLEAHLREKVTIEQICEDNLIGRSHLQKIFRTRQQCGVIDYFCSMKISAAKELIRSNEMNFTQIADYLGYTSIHYFSRQFKKLTGMTPSEYSSSIKALSD